MTPREPDRFEAKAMQIVDAVTDCMNGKMEHAKCLSVADHVAAALRGAESSALERAAQIVDDEEEGRTGRGFELGDVSDFRKRCAMTVSRKTLTLIRSDHITSPCHGAPIWASLGDGVMIGSCSLCMAQVCRANPRTGKAEWLNGNSPWDGRAAQGSARAMTPLPASGARA